MASDSVLSVVQSMMKFIRSQIQGGALSEDSVESLEVALQCLESAYNVPSGIYGDSTDLLELFTATATTAAQKKEEGENYKVMGNKFMKEEKYAEAVEAYTKAIEMVPTNAIYLCNRAAAYTKLENHHASIEDCQRAVHIDPLYSKAYSRLGFSYSSMGKHKEAKESYMKALEIEPDNDCYKSNMALAEQQLQEGAGLNVGGFDLSSFARSPGMLNIASEMFQDPNMRSAFQNPTLQSVASQMLQIPNVRSVITDLMNMDSSESNVDTVLGVSRELAMQLQAGHPDFIETIRREMSHILESNAQNEEAEPKDDSKE